MGNPCSIFLNCLNLQTFVNLRAGVKMEYIGSPFLNTSQTFRIYSIFPLSLYMPDKVQTLVIFTPDICQEWTWNIDHAVPMDHGLFLYSNRKASFSSYLEEIQFGFQQLCRVAKKIPKLSPNFPENIQNFNIEAKL